MEVVPTLCASGTVGIAAIGFAFGRPTPATSGSHHRREKGSEGAGNVIRRKFSLTNPLETPHTTSPPKIRALRSGVLRRPQSASLPRFGSRFSNHGVIGETINERDNWRVSLFEEEDEAPTNSRSPDLVDNRGGTVKSTWLRRMSTISISQNGSPASTPPPGTPSISFSNSSSVPFIPTTTNPTTPRNKLVKRTTSQRALLGSDSQYNHPKSQLPTLRRPATSYQRSANMQKQFFGDEVGQLRDYSTPQNIKHHDDTLDDNSTDDGSSMQAWQPYFRGRKIKVTRDTSLKVGGTILGPDRNEFTKRISPVVGDIPTLMMANSITSATSDETFPHPETPTTSSSPLTPSGILHSPSPFTGSNDAGSRAAQERRPRASFSIGDIFPSPSPSGWKLPRKSSLRRKTGPDSIVSGRRVASAPLPSNATPIPSNSSHGANNQNSVPGCETTQDVGSAPQGLGLRSPSSPLPPVTRLFNFETELPETKPSPPSSQKLDSTLSSSSPHISNPTVTSNPLGEGSERLHSHRPSGAPSDRASTFMSSDNDNSRIFASETDETDYRSDTLFDSVRTGVTGNSHFSTRGPPIHSVNFDASPPPKLREQSLTALQETFVPTSQSHMSPDKDLISEEESIRTPMGAKGSDDINVPTPSRYPTRILSSPDLPSSPPEILPALNLNNDQDQNVNGSSSDDWWVNDGKDDSLWDEKELAHAAGDHSSPLQLLQDELPFIQDGPVSWRPGDDEARPKSNIFEWSERNNIEKESQQGSSPRPKTAHAKPAPERGSRTSGRRGPSALHLRSQSVPLAPDTSTHRGFSNAAKLDRILGNKGVSEDWDDDFEFDQPVRPTTAGLHEEHDPPAQDPNRIQVPRAILERQASVHGQFGQVKDLTILVEELKWLRRQASIHNLLNGQSSELWKEADGIINLATLDDDEGEFFPPRSPRSPSFDFDSFDEDSPVSQKRYRSEFSPSMEDVGIDSDSRRGSNQSSPMVPKVGMPTRKRSRKESVAKAKFVLENIHQQRSEFDPTFADMKATQKKLPFDTTSLRDLVTRAGVVKRALKEIVRKAEEGDGYSQTLEARTGTPPDHPLSQIFHQPPSPPQTKMSPRSVKNTSNSNFLGAQITNDNDINGHMKMMTVV